LKTFFDSFFRTFTFFSLPKDQLIAGIDIGGSKVRTVIASFEEGSEMPHIIGVGVSESSGLRKGNIVDIEETIKNVSFSLEQAERMAGETIDAVYVGVSGNQVKTIPSRGVVAISNAEVNDTDVQRVLEAAQTIPLPMNRVILRIVPKSFTIDEHAGIKHPIGMNGIRLEVDAQIITGVGPNIKNTEKCLHQAGVDIEDFVPAPLAAADSVLSKRQKELGVVSVDIGLSTTSICVYEEGVLLQATVLPIGGENVTNDIAIGLRTSIDAAEKLKIEYGSCTPNDVSEREEIDLSMISKLDQHRISKKELAEIIDARYSEIFSMVREELVKIDRDGKLPAGAILTGSAIKIPGCLDLARNVLGLPVQIGFPHEIEGLVDKIDDPSFATMLGLITMGAKHGVHGSFSMRSLNIGKAFKGIGGFFKRLLP
jgi:cell division protein FtsA